jgi:hypothetical protein
MTKKISHQRGQAIVLFAFAILGMIAMVALAIDSANAYSGRRKAQTSSDNAALAAALKLTDGADDPTLLAEALNITRENGFSDADVTFQHPVGPNCSGNVPDPVNHSNPRDKADYYVQVIIRSTYQTYFGPIIGVTQLESCVSAIARGKPILIVPPFNGNAVVGVDPNGASFDAQSNSTDWEVRGGGIFANHNAVDFHGNVEFPDGDCITAVGGISGFLPGVCQHPNQVDQYYEYPEDILELMPPTPPCDGEAFVDTDDKIHPEPGYEERGSVWTDGFGGDVVDFAPGLYCLPDIGNPIHDQVKGNGVTFYISDTDFTMKYNGSGAYFNASAPTSGPFKGLLMFSAYTPTICNGNNVGQNVDIRGNGSTPIQGTVFMPSACIDWRGNGEGDADRSMIIGYRVTSNGDSKVSVLYNPDDNWKAPEPPVVELTR